MLSFSTATNYSLKFLGMFVKCPWPSDNDLWRNIQKRVDTLARLSKQTTCTVSFFCLTLRVSFCRQSSFLHEFTKGNELSYVAQTETQKRSTFQALRRKMRDGYGRYVAAADGCIQMAILSWKRSAPEQLARSAHRERSPGPQPPRHLIRNTQGQRCAAFHPHPAL